MKAAKCSQPEQCVLTRGNDLAKTAEMRRVVENKVDSLNDLEIKGLDTFFAEDFWLMGKVGSDTRRGLREVQETWQMPIQAVFSEKVCVDEVRLAEVELMAALGYQKAIHFGEFMGIKPTEKSLNIRNMDFWNVVGRKNINHRVMVDFPHVLKLIGEDVYNGQCQQSLERGERVPPHRVEKS